MSLVNPVVLVVLCTGRPWLALVNPLLASSAHRPLMPRLFHHGERVEEVGLGEEIVEPVLVEGEEPGSVIELARVSCCRPDLQEMIKLPRVLCP
jgi:hypothetical protein